MVSNSYPRNQIFTEKGFNHVVSAATEEEKRKKLSAYQLEKVLIQKVKQRKPRWQRNTDDDIFFGNFQEN